MVRTATARVDDSILCPKLFATLLPILLVVIQVRVHKAIIGSSFSLLSHHGSRLPFLSREELRLFSPLVDSHRDCNPPITARVGNATPIN